MVISKTERAERKLRMHIISELIRQHRLNIGDREHRLDNAIDKFIEHYDNNTWCRGWFKSQIKWLVEEALDNRE